MRGCRCLLVSEVMLGGLFVGLGYEASAFRSPCSGPQIRNPAGLNFKNSCKHKCGSQAVLVMPAAVLAIEKQSFAQLGVNWLQPPESLDPSESAELVCLWSLRRLPSCGLPGLLCVGCLPRR